MAENHDDFYLRVPYICFQNKQFYSDENQIKKHL